MSSQNKPPAFRGRNFGIVVLTVAQLLIGVIHIFFGSLLIAYENRAFFSAPFAYDVYTLVYGLLILVFAFFFWQGKKAGWWGTVVVSIVVIAADALTLLNLPSIPGIPKLPAFAEIMYSLLVIFYLIQPVVRKKYLS